MKYSNLNNTNKIVLNVLDFNVFKFFFTFQPLCYNNVKLPIRDTYNFSSILKDNN